jgi:type IV pilus assembly protein PilQ
MVAVCATLAPHAPAIPPLNDGISIAVSAADRVELHVADAPLASVLRILSTQSQRNIIASPAVKGTVTADLFDVEFHKALRSILRANDCDFVEDGQFIYVYTQAELAEQRAAASREQPVARLFRLNYIAPTDLLPMIEPLLSEAGKIAATPEPEEGIATSSENAGGVGLAGPDAIMVFDYPSRIREIEKVIRDVDVRPKQVLVEATILRAQLGEDNALGIDFNLVGGVDFELIGSTSNGVQNLNTGAVPPAEFQNTSFTARTDFNNAIPNGGLTFGIIKDQIAVFLRALEQVTDTTVLANPKVLTLNKQRGEVIVGRRDGYLTTTVTETTAIQTVEFLETGTRLVFRPFIGDDGFVRMEIHPEDSAGELNEDNLPFERTTEVTTNVIIRDGHTILIGGLFRESTNIVRSQVPIAGNIPIAGAAFRTTSDQTGREEVIILLTVRVVKDDAYEKAGDALNEDVERLRIGNRRGVQAFGRERLALAHYHWARQHYEAGDLDKALWDARLAVHISPMLVPAIKLKEELIGRHSCDREIGVIRNFIATQIMGKPRQAEPTTQPARPGAGATP